MRIRKIRKKPASPRRRSQRLYRQAVDNANSVLALTVDTIVGSFGKQALDVLQKQVTEKFTEEVRALALASRDAIAAAGLIDAGERLALIQGKFVEKSPERVVKRVTLCPVAELKLSPNYCRLMGYTAQGICKGVDDTLNFALVRCMTKGDSYCEWVVE